MFKTLFNIIIIAIGFATSAHANTFELLKSTVEQSVVESSSEVSAFASNHHPYIDVQTEQSSVVTIVNVEPSPSEEISVNYEGLSNRSSQLFALQHALFVRAERDSVIHIHLRAILFPFHSFW